MKNFFVYFAIALTISGFACAKDKTVNCVTQDDLQFCTDEKGEPITGKVAIKGENGITKSLENLKNGYRNGLQTEFDDDGSLKSRTYYDMGVLNGQYKLYHKNRQLKVFANNKEGKFHGNSEIYDEEGNLIGKILYNKGRVKSGYCRRNAKAKKDKLTFFEIQNMPENYLITCGQ